MSLSWSVVGSDDAPRTAWILHGILGSGRNWRSFARRLASAHPQWRFVLPDLRNHGDTGPLPPPHRLVDCVADLDGLPEPEVVLGHSFGGKVALAWAGERGTAREVWVLDSIPLADDGASDAEVMAVLGAVESVAVPASERSEMRDQLASMGLSPMLIAWLLTSARRTEHGWTWCYGLSGIREMMADYFESDFGAFLKEHPGDPGIHLVRAARSDRWTPTVLEGLRHLGPGAHLHVLEDAGHWLHVDNPDGLLALIAPAFTPAGG